MTGLSVSQTDEMTSTHVQAKRGSSTLFPVILTDLLLTPYRSPWVLFDLFSIFWLFIIGTWSSPYETWGMMKYQNIAPAIIFTISYTTLGLGMGSYERPRRFARFSIFVASLGTTLFSLLISLAAMYFIYYEVFGRLTLIYGAIYSYLGAVLIRFFLSQFLRRNPYRFTILGSSPCCEEIKNYCMKKRHESRYYTYIDESTELFPEGVKRRVHQLREQRIPNLVLAKSALDNPDMLEFALQALQEGCRIIDEITFYIQFFEKVPIQDVSKSWILHEGIDTRPLFYSLSKRIFDIVSSLSALIVLSPLFLLLGLIIKLTSSGPVFYIQTRMGRFCQPFKIIKFRTMTFNPHQNELVSTALNDPRVTGIGKLMRPLHIDELPQLWNVLTGKMSIVGPRPEAYDFAQKMRNVPLYDLRHLMRPGITGHAQITQGYTLGVVEEMTEKLEYDLYYISHCSFTLDIRIIIRTLFCLVKGSR